MSPRTIRFLDWAEYIAPTVLTRFEIGTGIHVEEVLYRSEEECGARLLAGEPFDVVMATDYIAAGYRMAGLLQPLDMDRLPNWRHVTNPRLRKPPHDPETDGRKYTSVNYFGTEGFAVRFDKVATIRTSWDMLYDPAHAGRITMVDGAREVLAPALYLLGSDPNTTDPGLIEQAAARAVDQRPLVVAYSSDAPARRIIEGIAIVHCWDGDAARAIAEGTRQVRYVLPQEGFSLWADGPCVPRWAPDVDGAYRFIDFLLEPAVAAENASYSGYQTAVAAAASLVKSPVQRALRPSESEIEHGTFLADLGESNELYEKAYKRVGAA